jgi:tRNA-dihydrouridine synthase A
VYRIREQFADSAFVINGGIDNVDDALQHLSLAGNIMLGRAIYNNPFLLAELEQSIYQQPVPGRLEILANYRQYVQLQMDAGVDFKHMARHLLGLFSGVRGARAFRRHLSTHMFDAMATTRVLDDALQVAGLSDAGNKAETVITDTNRSSAVTLTGVTQ